MQTLVSRDGWFFVSQSLVDLLRITEECDLHMNVESIEALLFGKEQFVLLKATVPPEEEPIEDFHGRKFDIWGTTNDVKIKTTEIHFGGGIYREGESWKLFIPLEV